MVKASVHPVVFDFAFEAGTSRGVLKHKTSWFIGLEENQTKGWGECSPIKGLSPEPMDLLEAKIATVLEEWKKDPAAIMDPLSSWKEELILWPSLRFAMETAYLDFLHGGKKQLFETAFFEGKQAIPINGLVWMNTIEHMQAQIEEKLKQGFQCIKLKIGHYDFEEEFQLLKQLRARFPKEQLTIRVDANGAYEEKEVFFVLDSLASIDVHSIEQPIKEGQLNLLQTLCRDSPVDIALDEELIKPLSLEEKLQLLSFVKPQYLVLKPSLHGGFIGCEEWITLATQAGIGWWITSYLESSIGLNAIAQFVSQYPNLPYQGLGTGNLYKKNIKSPLETSRGCLVYKKEKEWNSPVL